MQLRNGKLVTTRERTESDYQLALKVIGSKEKLYDICNWCDLKDSTKMGKRLECDTVETKNRFICDGDRATPPIYPTPKTIEEEVAYEIIIQAAMGVPIDTSVGFQCVASGCDGNNRLLDRSSVAWKDKQYKHIGICDMFETWGAYKDDSWNKLMHLWWEREEEEKERLKEFRKKECE